jgi:hypothetical protein
MTAASSEGALKQTNWAARFFWFTSMTFAIIGGGMEAYVYFAFTDKNLWNWVGIAEAAARAIGTQLVIMTLTLAGVKLWQSGAHVVWKVLLFAFFQVIAFGAATHGFVLVWVAAVAFRRDDLLGTADQGSIEIPLVGTFPLATLVLVLIAALPYYETILSLIGPIVTKERRALSPQEIREMREREAEMRKLNAERQQGMAETALNVRTGVVALFTGKKAEPLPTDSQDGNSQVDETTPPDNVTSIDRARANGKRTALQWTYRELQEHVRDTYHVELSDEAAKKHVVIAARKEQRLEGVAGNPYWVNRSRAIKYCRETFAAQAPQEMAD